MGESSMNDAHIRKCCGLSFLLAALFAGMCALPLAAPSQSGSGVVDVVKPDTPKQEAPATPQQVRAAGSDGAANGTKPTEPTDPKARKTFEDAIAWEKQRDYNAALADFRKANKQDGGHCWECLRRAYALSIKLNAYKDSVDIARDIIPTAQSDKEKAQTHFLLAMALQVEGGKEKKQPLLNESSSEFKTSLDLDPKLSRARFHWGVTLAQLNQDDAARAQFTAFLDQDRSNPSLHERAERFIDRIELARATMAPPFMATTLDGREISMDSLAGKVVLIDFWATWCGPCREALPRIKKIAQKFDGQPLVVLSISLDSDEGKWKEFVEKNGMTWMQVRDGGFNGKVATKFGVNAIPATFSIDAEGVLEDQHVGDADIEGKLKKLVARAAEAPMHASTPTLQTRDRDTPAVQP
jgi:thiol-disulfide isomerase/thioredoxin